MTAWYKWVTAAAVFAGWLLLLLEQDGALNTLMYVLMTMCAVLYALIAWAEGRDAGYQRGMDEISKAFEAATKKWIEEERYE